MPPQSDVILALVALIQAVASGIALIIHALRVPYPPPASAEAVKLVDAGTRHDVAVAGAAAAGVNPPLPDESSR